MFALWWLGATISQYLKLYFQSTIKSLHFGQILCLHVWHGCLHVYNEAFQAVHVTNLAEVYLNYE